MSEHNTKKTGRCPRASGRNQGRTERSCQKAGNDCEDHEQNKSNLYCEKNRRFRAGGDYEGNSQDHATAGRRPLTENIDTGICVLLRDAGDCGERVHQMNTPVRCIAAICACKVKKFFLSCLHDSLNSKAAAIYRNAAADFLLYV